MGDNFKENWIYYDFLLTLSRLFEKKDEGYIYHYGSWHLSTRSMFGSMHDDFLKTKGRGPIWYQ